MLMKIMMICSLFLLVFSMNGCSGDSYEPEYVYYDYDREPTAEELRAKFKVFFEENRDRIIASVSTEGEEIHLELGYGYDFIMTIVLDDVKLDDDNRALYFLAFELTFSHMTEFFGGLSEEIREDANIDNFRLTVVFVDIEHVEIAKSNFDSVRVVDYDNPGYGSEYGDE